MLRSLTVTHRVRSISTPTPKQRSISTPMQTGTLIHMMHTITPPADRMHIRQLPEANNRATNRMGSRKARTELSQNRLRATL
ncbi:MAG: hypothetical protein AAF989_11420 [Planctomycetota bacterium]